MKKNYWKYGVLLGLGCASLPSLAQSAEPSKILRLNEVVVQGSADVSPPPPSATLISSEEIEQQHYDKALYIMQKIPGVTIMDYGQGAVASQFTMRGVRLGHNSGVAIFVDGVPISESTSHGDGYNDFNTLIPEDIDYIEVIKGPSSALYGQFARAGVVNIVTKRSRNFGLYKLGFGDFGRQRFAASAGHQDGKMRSVVGVELSRSEGATDNSNWDLGNATGKFTYDFHDALTAGITLNLHTTSWDHPEYLSRDQWNAGEYWSARTLGGGKRYRYGLNTNLTYNPTDHSSVNLMLYGYTMNLSRYRDQLTSVNEEYHDRDMFGGSASYVWSGKLADMPNTMTAGIDSQIEKTHTINARNPNLIRTAREVITVDGKSDIRTYSAYIQNQLLPNQDWKVTLGGRYDRISGELDNRITSAESEMNAFNIFGLKGSMEYTPVQGYTLFSTYGNGFRLPNGFDKFNSPHLEEETYTQYEAGLKFTQRAQVESTLTGFILDVKDEIVSPNLDSPVKENQGETRRKGLEWEIKYNPLQDLFLYGIASYTKGEYQDWVQGGVSYSGTQIPGVPKVGYSFGAQWKPMDGFFASFDYRRVGKGLLDNYPADFTGQRLDTISYWVADAQVGYQYEKYSLTLDGKNLFDQRYPSTESANSLRTANPRALFLTFAVSY